MQLPIMRGIQPVNASPERFANTIASVLLDTFRGVAALLVCIGHWRYLFFINYPGLPEAYRKLWLFPYALCSLGHSSVVVFFVLSGYLVGGQALRAVSNNRWNWKNYLLQRSVRLYIVLIPALLIGGSLDQVALHNKIAPLLYHGQIRNFLTPDVSTQLSWKTLLGNLIFLQTRYVTTWGSNGPLWSLSNEFWYYILFPCILLAVLGSKQPLYRTLMICISLFIILLIGPLYLLGFAIWLFGASLSLIPVRVTSASFRWWALALYVPIFILSGQDARFVPNSAVGLVGILTALLLWVFLGAKNTAPRSVWVRGSRSLASFSYTLYLLHVPALTFLAGLLCGDQRWLPDFYHVLLAGLAFTLVLGLAFTLAKVTEARTIWMKDWIQGRFV